jgi:hypothetical protein
LLVESGDFPDELDGGSAHFFVGDGWIEVEKGFDVSAHGLRPRASGSPLGSSVFHFRPKGWWDGINAEKARQHVA